MQQDTGTRPRRSAEEIAADLVRLYGQPFGGKRTGKFRVSRKFLREISGRRHLPPDVLRDIASELGEAGYSFLDLESYFVVIDQRLFDNYRRVTATAIAALADGGRSDRPPAEAGAATSPGPSR